jgi:uncharacterized protein YxeA
MKKILGVLGIVALAAITFFGFRYYMETYQGETAYAVVPKEVPQKTVTKDMSGKEVSGSYSYYYTFIFVKSNGQTQKMDYEISGEQPTPLEPGSYVVAKISKKRVTEGPNPIEVSKIPKKAKQVLDQQMP